MSRRCDRDHTDEPLQAEACAAATELSMRLRLPVIVGILGEEDTACSLFGNATSIALLIRTQLTLVAKNDRPRDCVMCADAYDRMMQAKAILEATPARC